MPSKLSTRTRRRSWKSRFTCTLAGLLLAAASLLGPATAAVADTAATDPIAYVAEAGGMTPGGIVAVDTVTDTVVSTVDGIATSAQVVLNPVGTLLYATNGGSSVAVIDTSTNEVVEEAPVSPSVTGFALNPAGTVAYTTDFETDTVSVINTATMSVTATIPGVGDLNIAVDPTGASVYAFNRSEVNVIDTATNTITATIPIDDPGSIAFSPNGRTRT